MSSETIICRRCGVANSSGDQFCGSCGAFLEWEGDEAPVSTDAPAPPEPEPASDAGETLPPSGTSPPPPSSTPLAPAPRAPMPGFSVCPTCGSGNPPGRTFCHSCGNLLARDTTAPGATAGAGRAAADERTRSLPGWLPFVVGAGLVAGIVAVVVLVVFRPAAPPSTALPSSTLTPTLAVPPSVTVPPGSGPSSGAIPSGVAPSVPAGGSAQLTLGAATASSVSADTPDVAAINVMDGRLDTRWQEAIGSAPGEWIEVSFGPSRLDYLVVYSGFQLSHDAFLATRRPQNVVVTVNGGAPAAYVLADSELPQRIDITDTPGASVARIQVLSTFPASATPYPGSPIEAATISEIRAFGVAGG
ncbi:MAG TPA: zinc ribbon domain-containing protein [Candidatus Limnocylindrales bacterium]|nr:zinc ribbon domain-containing protein [Candidatus Limnocylindrales bacterium]